MYHSYFEYWEVKPHFTKEFISLWSGWLRDESYKLDLVTEKEWSRFNTLIKLIAIDFELKLANCETETLDNITDVNSVLDSYDVSMNKDSSKFTKLVIPKLDCVITEEWDYTYILWHKNSDVVEKLAPYIKRAQLKHFSN